MRRLTMAALILMLGAASATNARAQERPATILERVFSNVLQDRDGRTPTVIMDDDRRDRDAQRGRTGRGTVDKRGETGDEPRVERRDRPRGRTADGRVEDRRGREVDARRERTTRTTRGDREVDQRSTYPDRERGERRTDDDEWDSERANGKKGNGPPFCRSGKGHPVFGMDWCRDKGFDGTDRDYDVRDRRDQGGWGFPGGLGDEDDRWEDDDDWKDDDDDDRDDD